MSENTSSFIIYNFLQVITITFLLLGILLLIEPYYPYYQYRYPEIGGVLKKYFSTPIIILVVLDIISLIIYYVLYFKYFPSFSSSLQITINDIFIGIQIAIFIFLFFTLLLKEELQNT